ncbi:hypothetical protein C1645_827779 [Glomus cerebriforme]|uniref:Uncharacterized protein n=1 Tax=Glomus cerebriforme TaxID=658196 RepID=A0A397SX25_9GLOM|nr:hypothetical protein C1645_827779 [Glomus cerebriforme]
MSTITTKFITDHKLTNEMSLEELSQYAPEILELLTTGVPKVDKEKRHQAHDRLQKGYKFSKEQAYALIPHERIGERDVKAISRTLIETASDTVVTLSHLSRLQRELRTLNALEKIITATKILEITRASNKIQQEHTEQRKNEGLHYPDYFSLESVKEWLDLYDIQEAIVSRALKDPRKPGLTYLSSFLKKDEYIPKSYEPLLSGSLRKLGAVFASVVHRSKNLSKANTYASEALRYSPDNYTSPSDRYSIVNFRRRGNLMIKQNHFGFLMKTNHIYGLEEILEGSGQKD